MADIFGPTVPVNQNQINQAGALDALILEQFTGEVEHTFISDSVLDKFLPRRPVKGTNTLTKKAIGRTQLQKLDRGAAPDGTQVDFSKASVVVDTTVLSRHSLTELETLQTDIDTRKEIAVEQGGEIAEFVDGAFCIMGAKAAAYTQSAYAQGSAGKPEGHFGASQVVLAAPADANDPAKLYKAISDLVTKMEEKKVKPSKHGVILILRPTQYNILMEAEQIVNRTYITSDGNTMGDVPQFKAWGIPVVSSTNLPNGVVTGHLLSNAANGNAYDGDFTNLVALAISPRALMVGETIPLKSHVWWSDASKCWFVDSWMAFGVGVDRVEFAGRIDKA